MPHSTDSDPTRHPDIWTAAWWMASSDIEIEATRIVCDEDSRLRYGPEEDAL